MPTNLKCFFGLHEVQSAGLDLSVCSRCGASKHEGMRWKTKGRSWVATVSLPEKMYVKTQDYLADKSFKDAFPSVSLKFPNGMEGVVSVGPSDCPFELGGKIYFDLFSSESADSWTNISASLDFFNTILAKKDHYSVYLAERSVDEISVFYSETS